MGIKGLPKQHTCSGTERAPTHLLFYSKRYIVDYRDGHHTADVLNYIFVILRKFLSYFKALQR